MYKIVVLISGSGSNLQAIIDAKLNIEIAAVISNKPDVYGLVRAQKAHIPTHVIHHNDFSSRDEFDWALQQQIDPYQPDLIVLAGFMRKLGADFVNHYEGKMINLHPSLLPKYPGLRTHQKVLKNKEKTHGSSIHFVTPDLDAGPLIAQSQFTVEPTDDEQSLQEKTQTLEHQLYPKVIQLFSENRIKLVKSTVFLDESPMETPLVS